MELGAMKIGVNDDHTKEMEDGLLKLPTVMKDKVVLIVEKYPELKRDINIIGYQIQGAKLVYMKLDYPEGYICRIRRTKDLDYPSSLNDYKSRMPAIIRSVYEGFKTMNDTLTSIQGFKTSILQIPPRNTVIIPPSTYILEKYEKII